MLDERGREVPDPTPVEWPAGMRRPESLTEQIQRLVRVAVSQQAAAAGFETFEEADDFDVDDEEDPLSQYELTAMQEEARMGKDASNLEHRNPRSDRDVGAEREVDESRVADSEGVSKVQSNGVQEVVREGPIGERSGGAAEGRKGGRGGA